MQTIYHNPKDTHVAIATVGGICPGMRFAPWWPMRMPSLLRGKHTCMPLHWAAFIRRPGAV